MKRNLTALAVIIIAFFLIGVSLKPLNTAAAPVLQDQEPEKPPLPTQLPEGPMVEPLNRPFRAISPVDEAVRTAFTQAAENQQQSLLAFMMYQPEVDSIHYSSDGQTALIWIALRDPLTGEIVETEPGLAIARGPQQAESAIASNWQITLESAQDFSTQVAGLPADLLTEEVRERYLQPAAAADPSLAAAAPYYGYRLPWTAGTSRRLTGSIGHFLIYNSCSVTSCRYAYDFADGTMFPLLASKGGTVKSYRVDCPNFNESCTNYLVLEDQSTIPTTYQLYFHLAYNSVPQKLRVIGTQVQRGEYVGDVDDTGYSSGHHLHFHVYERPTRSDWSWGNSVDFIYEDVGMNGGHPRTCYEATTWPSYGTECNAGSDGKRGTGDDNWFVSGNVPANPPFGTMAAPTDRQWVGDQKVYVAGAATDDVQISRIQVVVNYDGTWRSIADIPHQPNGTYGQEVDLCAANVPNGPFALTVKIYDREGSQAQGIPIRHLIKNFNCGGGAPPAASVCAPAENQIALYTDPDFRGACQKYTVSSNAYTVDLLGAVGDNKASSIEVGSGVRATLYDRSADATSTQVNGRIETFEIADANLADNRIGTDTVSGLKVESVTLGPAEPFLRAPGNQYLGGATSLDSLVLSWEGGGRATSFDVKLQGPSANWTRTVTGSSISVGTLAAGTYNFSVVARNSQGTNESNIPFTVAPGSLLNAAAKPVPFTDAMDYSDLWTASGLWRHGSVTAGTRAASPAWVFNDTTDYSDPAWKAGDLTSPPIALPGTTASYLRFLYFANTEDGNVHWDQRRVQVSVFDGSKYGPFVDLVQLSDDKQLAQGWFNSGPISLEKYKGQTVRIRFHFDAVDEDRNTGFGWAVDDISVNTTAPNTACSDGGVIPALTLGVPSSGVICPEGDLDYYAINVQRGQQIAFDLDARTLTPASSLDSHIFLLDSDGKSVLAENDDEEYNKKVDSLLTYTFTRSGLYLLKVKAWNHPGIGSTAHFYNLTARIVDPTTPPNWVAITYPHGPNLVPAVPFTITAAAKDYDGGDVKQVDFYWHSPDWNNPTWVKLGSDTNPADGWSAPVSPGNLGGVSGSAIYYRATSRAGGSTGWVWWELQPDRTAPTSELAPLPSSVNSTAVILNWTAQDPLGDVSAFELQYQKNGGAWQTWNERLLTGKDRFMVFVGDPGTYGFRIRAADSAGNVEAFPSGAEARVTLNGTCTPDALESPNNSAISLSHGVNSPVSNLCSGDSDWFSMQMEKGEKHIFSVLPANGSTGVSVTLYNSSLTKVASWTGSYGIPVSYAWIATGTQGSGTTTYYVEVKPVKPGLYGSDVRYTVRYNNARDIFLPITRN